VHPALVITLAAAAALPLGLWLRRDLNQLSYRTADERHLPHPGPRWWVVWAYVLVAAALSAAASLSHDPLPYLPLVPMAFSGPWIAAVDFDVMRIPNRVMALTTGPTLAAVLGLAAAEEDWTMVLMPAVSALVVGGSLAGLHFATKGGIGFGDVKLAALNGLALGLLGMGVVWLGLVAGSVAALIWRRVTHEPGPIPYGPWLLAGSGLAAALIATLA
jgi:leader peptidase (prepilin peptidase)/N-methyltransferase